MPTNKKCEWKELEPFVEEFNRINGTHYERKTCLDIVNRNSKQPEVLLTCAGLKPVVIERKAIVWPPDFLSKHSKFHRLGDTLSKKLSPIYNDSPYLVYIDEQSLLGLKLKEIPKLVDRISGDIVSQKEMVNFGELRGRYPIPWRFQRVCPEEEEIDMPKKGVGLHGSHSYSPNDFETASADDISGFSNAFLKATEAAAKKFCSYPTARKLLLVQFFGDSIFVSDENLLDLIQGVDIKNQIDEVWYAVHDWKNNEECAIAWKRAK